MPLLDSGPIGLVGDVTADAAAGYVPLPDAAALSPSAAAVAYDDPSAVAAAFLETRLSYRYDDLAGYAAAVTALAYTTPAFAQRSTPTPAETSRVVHAQQTSAIEVGQTGVTDEAPATSTTAYITVACTVSTTYRGGSDTTPAAWTLRLLLTGGQWRVDGVLATD